MRSSLIFRICNSFRVLTVYLFIGIKMWFALTLGYVAKWRPNYTSVGVKKIHSFYGFPKEKTYINGKWVTAKDKNVFSVVNPANGENIATVPDCKVSDLDDAIEGSLDAFKTWSNTTGKERSAVLRRMFDIQLNKKQNMATILTTEAELPWYGMVWYLRAEQTSSILGLLSKQPYPHGKNLKESEAEINYGASFLEWFSEEARRIYGDVIPSPYKDKQLIILKQPLGVAGIITPWNFPNAMITRKVGAALAAGCTCVIKPAEDTPLSALAFAQVAEEAQVPPGVINVVTSSKSNAPSLGKRLCESPKISTISFTGSTAVGKLLLSHSAPTVKRVSLELGGNAPFIVFNSAKLQLAVSGVIASKFRNSGQTCVCTNRILVQDGIHDEFVFELSKAMKQLIVGNGMLPDVNIGPLINEQAVEKVNRHVQDALGKGAKLVLGGKIHSCGKTFYEPTLLTNISRDMLMCKEETFGPVAAVMKFHSEEEAIGIANDTKAGLASYFYSEDFAQIMRVSRCLENGMVGVNEGIISTAEAAFGGIKESGMGREGSRYGIDEYVYMKYICLGGLN